ncbi:cytochrome P450 3A30-like [Clarias magur]|uniref:Cytochrome P450 3A n=1 Tax=Clarias magur TaxID=1594786 RepID=A0A8J4U5N7_CLAMG|nr:cytochrome P450 3A30-like [Clarias magur]
MQGILITCNMNERRCTAEAYSLLNEYADRLYGPELLADTKDSGSSSEDDVEAALQKEVKQFHSSTESQQRRFTAVESGANNVLFIRTHNIDPAQLVHSILQDLYSTRRLKSRVILRMLPVCGSCKAFPEDMLKFLNSFLQPWFLSPNQASYQICFKARNNNNSKRDDVIKSIAGLVNQLNPNNKVDLTDPELSIIIEVIKSVCCVSVIRDYKQFRKYNLQEVAKGPANQESPQQEVTKGPASQESPQQEVTNGAANQESPQKEVTKGLVNQESPQQEVGKKEASQDQRKQDMLESKDDQTEAQIVGGDVVRKEAELEYGYWPYSFFKRLGVPGPKPTPFFGSMLEYRKGIHNFDMECFLKYGKIWGMFEARQPTFFIMDKEIMKTFLIKECYSLFTNRRNFRLNGPLYDAVNIAENEDWRRIRSVLSPSFTSGRLKEMFGIMKSHSRSLVENLGKTSERGESADIKEFFGAYSMDVVTSTAFSVDIESLNNPKDPFVSNIKKMLKFNFFNPLFLAVVLFPFITPLLEKMDLAFFPTAVTDFFYASLQKIKSERVVKDHKKRVDFLQLMIDSQKPESDDLKGLNDHEILSQSMIFIFAGYETTSSTLSFLFYILASNPDTTKKLQKEIDETFPNKGDVDYDGVMNMDYLDAVLNESLRLYPVALRLERVCKKTVEINGLVIPKDSVVMVPIYALHRDPEYWPDPEAFKPERFTKENKESIDQYAYMPFGLGPRNCIGMRFALVAMKLAAVQILQRFDISLSEETKVPLELNNSGLLAPKNPIKLKFSPRKMPDSSSSNP